MSGFIFVWSGLVYLKQMVVFINSMAAFVLTIHGNKSLFVKLFVSFYSVWITKPV